MKFKSKRHLVLSLKKKSGVSLSDAEIKELLGIEGAPAAEEKAEEKPKEEPKKEEEKKPEDEKNADGTPKTKEDGAAPTVNVEDLGKQLAALQENVNMLMEAMATLMEGNSAPAEEAKEHEVEEPKEDEAEEETEAKSDDEDEEEMTEEEMEKELEKTISELETLEDEP